MVGPTSLVLSLIRSVKMRVQCTSCGVIMVKVGATSHGAKSHQGEKPSNPTTYDLQSTIYNAPGSRSCKGPQRMLESTLGQ